MNPAEKIWWKFKREFSNKLFENLEKLSDFLSNLANLLTKEEVSAYSACVKTAFFHYYFRFLVINNLVDVVIFVL